MSGVVPDLQLAQALRAMMARAKQDGKKLSTVAAIEIDLSINCDQYRAPLGGLSRPLIDDAAKGRPISKRTSEILRRFIKVNAADLLPPLIPKVDLDLARFFGADRASVIQAGRAIEGEFQTYARSTSMPDYVRLGRMSFRVVQEPDLRLTVMEEQCRPAMGTRLEWRIVWDGFAAPRGRSYFVVMRIAEDHYEDGTASLGIIKLLNPGGGRVQRAELYGLQHDYETGAYPNFRCILVRKAASDIITTFIPLIEFDNKEIIKDLCLEETIRDLKKKAGRKRKR